MKREDSEPNKMKQHKIKRNKIKQNACKQKKLGKKRVRLCAMVTCHTRSDVSYVKISGGRVAIVEGPLVLSRGYKLY